MKLNEGTTDRIIRGVAGAALLVVGLLLVKGTLGIVLDVVAAILLVTAAIGFCPLYTVFGIKTTKKS